MSLNRDTWTPYDGPGNPFPPSATPTFTRVDSYINYTSDEHDIGIRWHGEIEPEFTETYTFYVSVDDGCRLWINGILLIDQWQDQGITEFSGVIALTGGVHYSIQLDYYNGVAGGICYLSWQSTSQSKEIVPGTRLFPVLDSLAGNGLNFDFFENYVFPSPFPTIPNWSGRISTVNFSNAYPFWRDEVAVVFHGEVEPEFTGTYTFYVNVDDGCRLWINGQLLIDVWELQTGEHSGTILLTGGQKYNIRLEYFQSTLESFCQLQWSHVSQVKQVIPFLRLFPTTTIGVGGGGGLSGIDPVPFDFPIIYYLLDEDYSLGDESEQYLALNSGISRHGTGTYNVSQILPPIYLKGYKQPGARTYSLASVNLFKTVYGIQTFSNHSVTFPSAVIETLTEWSMEAWVYITGAFHNQYLFCCLPFYTGIDPIHYFAVNLRDQETGKVKATFRANNNIDSVSSINEIEQNKFTHVCVSLANGVFKLYLNGILESVMLTDITLSDVGIGYCGLNQKTSNSETADGYYIVDSVAIFDYELSPEQVLKHATGFIPIELTDLRHDLVVDDFVIGNIVFNRSFSDTVALSDFRGGQRSLEDVLDIEDVFNPDAVINFRLTENLFLIEGGGYLNLISKEFLCTDFLILNDNFMTQPSTNLTDILVFVENLDTPGLKYYNIVHYLQITDLVEVLTPGTANEYLQDRIFLYDNVDAPDPRFHNQDALIINDSLSAIQWPTARVTKDTLTFSDNFRTNLFKVTHTDTLQFIEKIRHNQLKFEFIHPLPITEKLHFSPMIESLTESFLISDTLGLQANHQYLQEDLEFFENVILHYSITNLSLSDNLTLTEDLHYIPSPIRLSDSLTISDLVGFSYDYEFDDTLIFSDSVIKTYPQENSDLLTISENLEFQMSKGIIDVLNLVDGACFCFKALRSLTDILNFSDSVIGLLNGNTTPPPVPGSGGGIIIRATYNRRLGHRLFFIEKIGGAEGEMKVCCKEIQVVEVLIHQENTLEWYFNEEIVLTAGNSPQLKVLIDGILHPPTSVSQFGIKVLRAVYPGVDFLNDVTLSLVWEILTTPENIVGAIEVPQSGNIPWD